MLAISYYNYNKEKIPKIKEQEAKYIIIHNALVLKRKQSNAIELPFIYGSIKNGEYIILFGKDNIVKFLKANIKPSWFNVLGYVVVNDYIPTGIWTKNKQEINYEIQYNNNILTLQQAKALKAALRNLNNELDISDNLLDTKNLIDETVNPSDIVGKYFIDEYEKKEIIYSDTLGYVLDLKNIKGNISGTPFDCMYRMSGANISKLNNIISQFGIEEVEQGELLYVYHYKDGDKIEFRKDGVYRIKITGDQETELTLFNKGIKLIGYTDTRFNIKKRMLEEKEIRYYYVEVEGKKELLEYVRNPDTFNNKYGNGLLRFLENNKALQLFYNGLDDWIEQEDLTQYNLIYENKLDLDNKIWVHGGEVLYNDNDIKYINYAPNYSININKTQISLQDVYTNLQGYYKKPYHHLIMLWFLGAWLKPVFNKLGINVPLMLCSGYTESGKTEMIKMIMELFGYSFNDTKKKARLLSLEGTTVFPVVRALTDTAPIFFDELTGSVKKEVEEALRGVFNNQNIEKGNADQTVSIYVQQAPVIIGGERMPSYQSVINRSILLPFSKDLRGDKAKYISIKEYFKDKIVLKAVWDTVNSIDIKSKIEEVGKTIKGGRVEENYMFLRYVNNIFNYMPNAELEASIVELKERQDKIIKGTDELIVFFTKLLSNNKQYKTFIMHIDKDNNFKIGLYVNEEEVRTKAQYIQDIKKMVYDNDFNNSNIDINMTKLFEAKTETAELIVKLVIRFFKGINDPVWANFLEEKIGIDDF